jgi:hypothetical protein
MSTAIQLPDSHPLFKVLDPVLSSQMAMSLWNLPLGGSEIWTGPEGTPVLVTKDADPEDPLGYFSVSLLEKNNPNEEPMIFVSAHEFFVWVYGVGVMS